MVVTKASFDPHHCTEGHLIDPPLEPDEQLKVCGCPARDNPPGP